MHLPVALPDFAAIELFAPQPRPEGDYLTEPVQYQAALLLWQQTLCILVVSLSPLVVIEWR